VPFVLDEDAALKAKLSNFTLINYAGGTKAIPVWYRFPDQEVVTRSFPHIAIDLTDITFDPERAHRAPGFNLTYDTETATPLTGATLVADDMPLPWNLIYQIACYSRQPTHDREMLLMMYQMFPEMYGSLDMSNYDGTVRRADLVSVVRRDRVDPSSSGEKRTYCVIFTISVSSEFFLNQLTAVTDATGINLTVVPYVNLPV
jgi:hypothetical protein